MDDLETLSDDSQSARNSTQGDPTGRMELFDRGAVPSIHEAFADIYEFVEMRAKSIGETVPRNRGLPPKADPRNMLSVEEKAVIILGRAVGLVWREIEDRIIEHRAGLEQEPPTRNFWDLSTSFLKRNGRIVAAIQADLLDAVEAFSPLVGGTQRFLWRAKLLEYYRTRIAEADADKNLKPYEKDETIRTLDRAMRPHLKFFDDLGVNSDIANALKSPAERAHEQAAAKELLEGEGEIERKFKDGEISDAERIDQLRVLRHG